MIIVSPVIVYQKQVWSSLVKLCVFLVFVEKIQPVPINHQHLPVVFFCGFNLTAFSESY